MRERVGLAEDRRAIELQQLERALRARDVRVRVQPQWRVRACAKGISRRNYLAIFGRGYFCEPKSRTAACPRLCKRRKQA